MSVNVDSSQWKLRTAGGIPYKLFEDHPRGWFEEEDAEIVERYIIESDRLEDFILESLSEYEVFPGGQWHYRAARQFSKVKLKSMVTRRVEFEPFPPSKPGDPFGIHRLEYLRDYADTFSQFTLVTITYSPGKSTDNDPVDLIELTANATGEFLLYPNVGNMKAVLRNPDTGVYIARDANGNAPSGNPSGPYPGQPGYDPTDLPDANGYYKNWPQANNTRYNSGTAGGRKSTSLPPSLPCTKVVPGMEWTAKFNRVPRTIFYNSLSTARLLLGKVNSCDMPILTGVSSPQGYHWENWVPLLGPPAPVRSYQWVNGKLLYTANKAAPTFSLFKETILFSGFSFSTRFTWRDTIQVATIEIKLLEKMITEWENGVQEIKGHNHVFNPNTGKWVRVEIGYTEDEPLKPLYELADLNILFFGTAKNPIT